MSLDARVAVVTVCFAPQVSVAGSGSAARLCAGRCEQVRVVQDALVEDEYGRTHVDKVVVNAGCVFVPAHATQHLVN